MLLRDLIFHVLEIIWIILLSSPDMLILWQTVFLLESWKRGKILRPIPDIHIYSVHQMNANMAHLELNYPW